MACGLVSWRMRGDPRVVVARVIHTAGFRSHAGDPRIDDEHTRIRETECDIVCPYGTDD